MRLSNHASKNMAPIYNFFIIFLLTITIAESADQPLGSFCHKETQRPQTISNIKSLLSILVSGKTKIGFVTSSYGNGKDKVFGLAQCRGYVTEKDCHQCIRGAATITKRCTNETDVKIWYDNCFLRYNKTNFFGVVDAEGEGQIYSNYKVVTGVRDFSKKLGKLVDKIRSQAVKPKNKALVGKGKTNVTDSLTIYAFVQCTSDLNPLSCAKCLDTIMEMQFAGYCDNREGCSLLFPSCLFRFEIFPFYFPLGVQNAKQDAEVKKHIVVSKA